MLGAWSEPKPLEPKNNFFDGDPLEPRRHFGNYDNFETGGFEGFIASAPTVRDFALAETVQSSPAGYVGDAAVADNSVTTSGTLNAAMVQSQVPYGLQSWYASQSFIGWQACALIAQHWLIDKACRQAGEDAVRNGYEITVSDGTEISSEVMDQIREMDKKYNINKQMVDACYWNNVFGIRVVMFNIESSDPKFYEKPFNIDGVTKGSYKGIRQIDPYWMTPLLTIEGSSDPTSHHFYDPEYWVISGKKYHRTHLIILRGSEPADILKPLYIYGGIPLVQRIYERVYAAERTANEAPLLATEKRTTAIHVEMKKVAMDQSGFEGRLQQWIQYRDNYQVKVLGKDEVLEQFDTSLTDFDSVIATQYVLVSAIAKVPYTKLMQTSPSGFQSTGEFEMKSYSQELEGVQVNECDPFLQRHHDLLVRNMGYDFTLSHTWRPTDAHTALEKAEINKMNVDAGIALVNAGVISADEERQRLRDDPLSGYGVLADSNEGEAETELFNVELIKAEGQKEKGEAALQGAEQPAGNQVAEGDELTGEESLEELVQSLKKQVAPNTVGAVSIPEQLSSKPNGESDGLQELVSRLSMLLNPPNSYPAQINPLAENPETDSIPNANGAETGLERDNELLQLVGRLAVMIASSSLAAEPGIEGSDVGMDVELMKLVQQLKTAMQRNQKPAPTELKQKEVIETLNPGVKPDVKPGVTGIAKFSEKPKKTLALNSLSRDGHLTAISAERDEPTGQNDITKESGNIEVSKSDKDK